MGGRLSRGVFSDAKEEVSSLYDSFTASLECFTMTNGRVSTTGGRTLGVAESMGRKLTSFNIQAEGSLSNRRGVAGLAGAEADGVRRDPEGARWRGMAAYFMT